MTLHVFTDVQRRFLTRALRPFLQGICALLLLFALALLGACGRSDQSTQPSVTGESAVDSNNDDRTESLEDEAAEDNLENQARTDMEWNQSAGRGEFETDYRAGETPTLASGTSVVLVGAGDIATTGSGDSQTAKLINAIPGTVFTAGDNAYSSGSASQFKTEYDPTWGQFKARTRPSPGNHDYNSSGAKPYYAYFGALAGPSGRGYYSYDIGDWHIVSLNSNISMAKGSAQEKWLRADLAASTKTGTLAYWHHPRFSSGSHGSSTKSKAIWQALYDYGAEIVVVGHDHDYERFAPQTADGKKDVVKGIREFVVGTGGTSLRSMGKIANSEARNSGTKGVIKFTLGPGTYQWEFIPVAGKTYRDSGSGVTH